MFESRHGVSWDDMKVPRVIRCEEMRKMRKIELVQMCTTHPISSFLCFFDLVILQALTATDGNSSSSFHACFAVQDVVKMPVVAASLIDGNSFCNGVACFLQQLSLILPLQK